MSRKEKRGNGIKERQNFIPWFRRFGRHTKLKLTNELIDTAIANESAYISAVISMEEKIHLEDAIKSFFNSNAYLELKDKEKGYYWDTPLDIIDMYVEEAEAP
jgi:hypothetical protein